MEEKEYPTPDNPIPIEKQTEYYYDTGEKMLIKGYKDMDKELELLNKIIDMMAEDLVKVPENDFMSDTQLSVVHYINAELDRRKQAVKEYYFKKARNE